MKKYIALFEYDENDGFGIVFPDLPGLATTGDDYDDAYRMAHEGLAFHLEGMAMDGYPIPEPRTFEQIKTEWENWERWEKNYKFLIVPIAVLPASEKSIRINVMLPEGTLRRIDAVSKNRSAFLANAAERMLDGEFLRKKA
jgi:predicted RNase H-like HicB family nuclease